MDENCGVGSTFFSIWEDQVTNHKTIEMSDDLLTFEWSEIISQSLNEVENINGFKVF